MNASSVFFYIAAYLLTATFYNLTWIATVGPCLLENRFYVFYVINFTYIRLDIAWCPNIHYNLKVALCEHIYYCLLPENSSVLWWLIAENSILSSHWKLFFVNMATKSNHLIFCKTRKWYSLFKSICTCIIAFDSCNNCCYMPHVTDIIFTVVGVV